MNGDREYDHGPQKCVRCRALAICGIRKAVEDALCFYNAFELDDLARICRFFAPDPRAR